MILHSHCSPTQIKQRERAIEKEKKEQFITLISRNIPQQLTRRTTACHTYREKYTRVSPRQHDDYTKGFRLTSCFNQTECDKQTIQTEKTWCCAQRKGGGGGGRREVTPTAERQADEVPFSKTTLHLGGRGAWRRCVAHAGRGGRGSRLKKKQQLRWRRRLVGVAQDVASDSRGGSAAWIYVCKIFSGKAACT